QCRSPLSTLFPYPTLFRSYSSVLLDRANRSLLAMCSKEGGVEIEQLAVERPEALARVEVDANTGIDEAKAREIVQQAGFDDETRSEEHTSELQSRENLVCR